MKHFELKDIIAYEQSKLFFVVSDIYISMGYVCIK